MKKYDFKNFKLYQITEASFLFCERYEDGGIKSDGHIRFHFLIDGEMAITGDFGSWVFRRCFHPKMHERLSRGYFLEKVYNQEAMIFDARYLQKELLKMLVSYEELDEFDPENFYYENEHEYYAYVNSYHSFYEQHGIDTADLPDGKIPCPWIVNIMDAYDYIFDNKLEV